MHSAISGGRTAKLWYAMEHSFGTSSILAIVHVLVMQYTSSAAEGVVWFMKVDIVTFNFAYQVSHDLIECMLGG